MNKVLIIDIETGGLNPYKDAICSISYKVLGEETIITHFIKPYEKTYNKTALAVNGISIYDLEKKGVSLNEALDHLLNYLCDVSEGNKLNVKLMGHNLHFDLKFMEYAYNEYMENDLFDYCHYHYKDTMQLADNLRDLGLLKIDKIKLETLYRFFFGEDGLLANAHESESDVLMTEKVYNKLIKLK